MNRKLILATLVYLVKDGQTLMIHRIKRESDNHLGKYNGLGGKFEEGETPFECAKREVFEESGLTLNTASLKGVISFPEFDKQGHDWLVFIYRSSSFSGTMKKENPEGILKWIDNDKLLSLPLWEGDPIFLKHLFDETYFEGKFFYKEKRLTRYEWSCF